MHKRVIVHTMLAMKPHSLGVVFTKQIVGIHGGILIAEESPHAVLLVIIDTIETFLGYILVLFYQGLCYNKVLHPILTRILKVLSSYHTMFLHRIAHSQSRVHQYAIIASKHLGIHTAH